MVSVPNSIKFWIKGGMRSIIPFYKVIYYYFAHKRGHVEEESTERLNHKLI